VSNDNVYCIKITFPPLNKLIYPRSDQVLNVTFVVCEVAKYLIANLFLNVSNMFKLNCILASSVSNVCRQLSASLNASGSSLKVAYGYVLLASLLANG